MYNYIMINKRRVRVDSIIAMHYYQLFTVSGCVYICALGFSNMETVYSIVIKLFYIFNIVQTYLFHPYMFEPYSNIVFDFPSISKAYKDDFWKSIQFIGQFPVENRNIKFTAYFVQKEITILIVDYSFLDIHIKWYFFNKLIKNVKQSMTFWMRLYWWGYVKYLQGVYRTIIAKWLTQHTGWMESEIDGNTVINNRQFLVSK